MPTLRARWSELCLSTTYLKTMCMALAFCLSLSTAVLAQGTGGRILGRISDPSGAVLSGAKVTATNDATGVTQAQSATTAATMYSPIFPWEPTR